MAYCTGKNPPVFTTEIEKWDSSTVAEGGDMAVEIEQLYNNTLYNKAAVEQVKGKLLTNLTIPAAGWNNLTFIIEDDQITESSTVYMGYNFDSIPAAQKANIRGKTEAGRLVLAAKKAPAVDLKVDEIRILNLREG
ncbi:hypothetical protein [Lachnoclostridium edouardi]|uniref:hypothetical protein n=1 Tax=Lachnoclostridium edouardi TaxID=1926283 RepID=UPI000C7CC899|nr:hypothetical protein [Lachnoclostridium edouardi]